jgi:hypothetical protein
MPSFHYMINFWSDVTSFVIVHKKCYELLLHDKDVLIVDLFPGIIVWLL